MQSLNIAIDCDGTLIDWNGKANEQVISLLKFFATCTKNCRVIVWSRRGEQYAKEQVDKLGLQDYVWRTGDKADEWYVDIAFDDMHEFDKGKQNVVVKL